MKPWTSPNYNGRSPWTAESCLNGRKYAEAAAAWIEKHPKEFNELFRIVKKQQGIGRVPYLRDRVKIAAHEMGITVKEGEYTFANGLWAPLVRYMAYADPSLVGNPVVFERSDVDNYGLTPCDFTLEYFTFKRTVAKDLEEPHDVPEIVKQARGWV